MPVCWKCRGMLDGSCVETCAGCKARACPGCETAWLRSCMENMLREAPTQDARNDSYFVTSEEGPWFENGVKKTAGEWFLALITTPCGRRPHTAAPCRTSPLWKETPRRPPTPPKTKRRGRASRSSPARRAGLPFAPPPPSPATSTPLPTASTSSPTASPTPPPPPPISPTSCRWRWIVDATANFQSTIHIAIHSGFITSPKSFCKLTRAEESGTIELSIMAMNLASFQSTIHIAFHSEFTTSPKSFCKLTRAEERCN